jgi:hypothetical protein
MKTATYLSLRPKWPHFATSPEFCSLGTLEGVSPLKLGFLIWKDSTCLLSIQAKIH